jgi:hypothetical protein
LLPGTGEVSCKASFLCRDCRTPGCGSLMERHYTVARWQCDLGTGGVGATHVEEIEAVGGASAPSYGRMFWFSWKKFVGSYWRLSARSRSYLASP